MMPDELRIPPQDVEAEKSVLGSILMDAQFALPSARELLQPESFYSTANAKIFHAMLELHNTGNPIDTITVREELRKTGQLEDTGDSAYLNELIQSVVSSANIEAHCQIVAEKYMLRSLMDANMRVLGQCYDGSADVFELIDTERGELDKLLSFRKQSKSVTDAEQSLQIYLDNVERIDQGQVSSLRTGFNELDNLLGGGFQLGDSVVLAGNTGTGKSSLALQMLLNVSQYVPTAYFSLEMSKSRMVTRTLAQLARLPIHQVRNPHKSFDTKEDAKRYKDAVQDYRERQGKLFLDCTPDLTIGEICLRIEKLVRDHGVKFTVVDHIGKLASDPKQRFQNREREIAHFSWKLTQLAIKHEIVILTISPLNKNAEEFSMSPSLKHMRDSGMLSYDARTVLLLGNPQPNKELAQDQERKAILQIAKQGDGESGVSIELPFHGGRGAYFGDGPVLAETHRVHSEDGREADQCRKNAEPIEEHDKLPF